MNVCVEFEDCLSDITGVQGFSLSSSHLNPPAKQCPITPSLSVKFVFLRKSKKIADTNLALNNKVIV